MKTTKKELLSKVADLQRDLIFEREVVQNIKCHSHEQETRNRYLSDEIMNAQKQIKNLKQAVHQLGEVIAHL